MGLSRTVSEINGNFSRKSQIFPPRVYLPHPLRGFPLEPGGRKKIEWWGYLEKKNVLLYL